MGSSRGGALQSYKSLNFNFKLNSRAESSWVSALVLRSSFWNLKNHRPRFYNKLRIVYIHGSIIARDDSVTKQHVYISREISNFVTFACVSRTYFFHLRFNFEREIVKPKLKHQIKRKEKLKRIYPTSRSRLICGKLINIHYSIWLRVISSANIYKLSRFVVTLTFCEIRFSKERKQFKYNYVIFVFSTVEIRRMERIRISSLARIEINLRFNSTSSLSSFIT